MTIFEFVLVLVLVLALILFSKIFVLIFFDFRLVLVFVLGFVLGFALGFALTFFNFVLRDYLSEIMELGADFYIFGFVMKRRTILHVVMFEKYLFQVPLFT